MGNNEADCKQTHVVYGTRCEFKFNPDVVGERSGGKGRPRGHGVKVAHTVRHVQATVAAAGKVSALHVGKEGETRSFTQE
jgi:hypothetical protein